MIQQLTLGMLVLPGMLLSACANAAEFDVNELIALSDDYLFRVETGNGDVVSVAFYYSGAAPENLIERYSYGNGTVPAGAIKSLELDEANDAPEYLVTINDRTSNYGAALGLILWKRGAAWRLVKIPHEKFSVATRDGRNLIDINGRLYRFEEGFFLAVDPR